MHSIQKAVAVFSLLCVWLIGGSASTYAHADTARVIKITAKRFEHNPRKIVLKKGEAVTLEFTSLDRPHGFNCPDLGIRTDIIPGKVSKIDFTPRKTGTFTFHCDLFCGEGHENMTGEIIVTE
jgi:cytochrome c oxidase subunit 2